MNQLTPAERELLSLVQPGRPINIEAAAELLGKPLSAVSSARNRLLQKGFVAKWRHYLDAIRATDAGRAALSHNPKKG